MTTTINGSSPSITFSDGTTQTTAANITAPYTSSGVVYASSTTALATGSVITFDGQTLANTRASPVVNLVDSSTSNSALRFVSSGGISYIQSGVSGSSFAPVVFTSNGGGTETMRLDSNGNLGLATSSITPRDTGATTLELYGPSSGRTAIKFTNSTSGTTGTDGMFLGYDATLNFNILNNESGAILFGTSNSERARIDSSGNLLVGTTSTIYGAKVSILNSGTSQSIEMSSNGASGTNYGIGINYTAQSPNNTGNEFIYLQDSTALRMSVRSNGGIANYSANNVNLSDRREKTNFAPSKSYLDVICAIPVQTFNYIDQNFEEDGGLTLGVVAQDVQAVAPELVHESNWANKDEPEKMRLSIYQTDLQYALMKSIQELSALVTAQSATITSLTERITALEGK